MSDDKQPKPRRESFARVKRLRPLRDEITDLPNLMTLTRIATLPVVLLLIDNYSRTRSFYAAIVFILGVITDVLDGWVARKRGQVTVLGQFLDPVADKLFVLSVLVWLVALGRVPEWLVVILLSREVAIMGLRSIASSYGLVIAAGRGGKAKMALQATGLVFLIAHFRYNILILDRVIDFHVVGTYLIYVSLVMSVWSFGEYLHFFVRATEEKAKRTGSS